MASVSREKMENYANSYKLCREVSKAECPYYKNCGTCSCAVYSQSSDIDDICTAIKKEA